MEGAPDGEKEGKKPNLALGEEQSVEEAHRRVASTRA